MTPTEIDALEAGPDLDRLVADACGIEYETNPNQSGLHEWEVVGGNVYGNAYRCQYCHCDCDDGTYGCGPEPPKDGCKPSPILFRPSTDWNDATLAAEKAFGVRQFRVVREVSHDPKNGLLPFWFGWSFEIKDENTHEDEWLCPSSVCDESGPVAICRAILKANKP